MADQDFDINSILEISYRTGEPETISASNSAPKTPNDEEEVILGLVPDDGWIGNKISRKEDKKMEDAERSVMDKKISQCEGRTEVKVSCAQQILNGSDSNTSLVRDNLAVSPVDVSDMAERKVSSMGHYRCTTCSEVFSESSLISKHSRTHPPRKKPFACNICGKLVTELCNLKRHIRFHTGEVTFTCNVCYKMFHTPDKLKIHMRFHSGHFPNATEDAFSKYRCRICMRPFARQWHLNKHFRIHAAEKGFLQQESTVQPVQQQS